MATVDIYIGEWVLTQEGRHELYSSREVHIPPWTMWIITKEGRQDWYSFGDVHIPPWTM